MKLKEVIAITEAKELVACNDCLEKEYLYVFACDLMSDVLALVRGHTEHIILLTGLANSQAIRTAEMLDIQTVLFVRGKTLGADEITMAAEKQIAVYTTNKTMFETCGLLYSKGIRGIPTV